MPDNAQRLRHHPCTRGLQRPIERSRPIRHPFLHVLLRVTDRVQRNKNLGEQDLIARPAAEIGVDSLRDLFLAVEQRPFEFLQIASTLVSRRIRMRAECGPLRIEQRSGRDANSGRVHSPSIGPREPRLSGGHQRVEKHLEPLIALRPVLRPHPEQDRFCPSHTATSTSGGLSRDVLLAEQPARASTFEAGYRAITRPAPSGTSHAGLPSDQTATCSGIPYVSGSRTSVAFSSEPGE